MFSKKIVPLIIASALTLTTAAQQREQRTFIIFFDGLRPDYITPQVMPNLHAFRKQGVYGKAHHSVFPTVTRVNSASYATGSYPKHHGLLGNTVYFPQVEKTKGLNTGEASDLMRIDSATNGGLLTAVSLGEVLAAEGKKLMVFSSGSSGQALLQNHKVNNGTVINPELILPVQIRDKVVSEIGTPPAYAKPNTARHKWMVDAFLKYGMGADAPLVSALWFSDPDATAHAYGIGAPQTMEALRVVDQEFGRVLEGLGNYQAFNILISTDHGFVTYVGKEGIADLLIQSGMKKSKESEDVVIAEGAIYVRNHDKDTIQKIVSLLQQQDWIGPVFTRATKPGSMQGQIAGTLSFDAIHWQHPERAADILVDEAWNDAANSFGYKGSGFSKGVAGHGGTSPFEITIPLILSGPGFRKATESDLPTSNVDIVPTVLSLHGIAVPQSMDGRVLNELMVLPGKTKPGVVKKETLTSKVQQPWGTYELHLELSVLGKYRYINQTNIVRTKGVVKKL
ncbi:Predicted pyrophosphatase or phosphodiesterase, AlkP superfamily [Cnuella takakiae]|uniref:Predicted pyrophosphatase or phosphodiesterase, AlkP superfamily n=1 Tax=Cnuella takakiae TaxID=1302690 RepID=A0A1M5CL49_9BACT|nr:nucleotide pyrophosphatase/phosphodiesterase family protein [Cnuella takakiae]OLY91866.1 alkaline phosphatase family protein [Cnuella takakiae]SHF55443.1 Predicted pyrophosphatase or phosphodiesterase, AlkP superfamily [Cnuella takakiae]